MPAYDVNIKSYFGIIYASIIAYLNRKFCCFWWCYICLMVSYLTITNLLCFLEIIVHKVLCHGNRKINLV